MSYVFAGAECPQWFEQRDKRLSGIQLFLPERKNFYFDRAPTRKPAPRRGARSGPSETPSGWLSIITLVLLLKASPMSRLSPSWRRWRCYQLRLTSSTSECLAPSAQTWTPPLSSALLWADLLNIDADTPRMCSTESTRLLFACACFPQVAGKHTPHQKSEDNLVRVFAQTSFIHHRGRISPFLPLREQKQHAALRREQREESRRVKDETCERITMCSWKQKPDVISHPYRLLSGELHTEQSVSQTDSCWLLSDRISFFSFSKSVFQFVFLICLKTFLSSSHVNLLKENTSLVIMLVLTY